MKILFTIINVLFFLNFAQSQNLLVAEGAAPDLYVTHTVSAKENFYSIGRLYNVSPKEIAPYNNLKIENPLNLGQTLKIPLTQNNFLQSDNAGEKSIVPVYHIVEPKEGLYHVSTTFNKVSLALLKKWNNLSTDAVSNGTKLIIGYLNVSQDQFSSQSKIIPVKDKAVKTAAEVKASPEAKTSIADVSKEKEIESKPPPSEKKNAEVITNNDLPSKQEIKPKTEEPVFNKSAINFKGGTFKKLYDDQSHKKSEVTETGTSGVFKSTSGWQDGKYYCFHNAAPIGTIVKITNNATGKIVYAKVLDLIPDIEQNEGLILHISNSAAEELGVSDNKFDCSLTYAK